jgi:hypothetical protein
MPFWGGAGAGARGSNDDPPPGAGPLHEPTLAG